MSPCFKRDARRFDPGKLGYATKPVTRGQCLQPLLPKQARTSPFTFLPRGSNGLLGSSVLSQLAESQRCTVRLLLERVHRYRMLVIGPATFLKTLPKLKGLSTLLHGSAERLR